MPTRLFRSFWIVVPVPFCCQDVVQRVALNACADSHHLPGNTKGFQRRALLARPALNMGFDLHARARPIAPGQIVENLFANSVLLQRTGRWRFWQLERHKHYA